MPRGAIPEYPPILRGSVEEQMIQLREYIIRNIEAMQRDLTASGGTIYVDNGVAYVTINGSTMTLQEFIQNYVDSDGNTINITVNANIENNPDLQDKTITITANGTQTVTPDEGKDGLSSVEITVNVPQGITPSGTINITNNGTHDVTNYASANVQVPATTPTLQSKNATPSGSEQTIQPDSGYDGLSSVIIAAAPLETKIVTPSASQQIITPSSGQYGMSQVTVAGDADLIAGNIKKDIVIFGITGTYEGGGGSAVNGSLIVAKCSTNISQVTATIGGNTFTAYLDTSSHIAYVTIPYTITSGTVRLHGFVNGSEATWADVTLSGIDKYVVDLDTSQWLFRNGTWYGLESHEWIRYAPSTYAGAITVTEENGTLKFVLSQQGGGTRYAWVYLSPRISNRGYSQLEIVVDSFATTDAVCAQCVSSISEIQSYTLSVGTNVIPCTTDGFYLEFYMNDWTTRTVNTAIISSIRFV